MTAALAERSGYPALFLSGAAVSISRAEPDAELRSAQELVDLVASIVRATEAPLLVDMDTGFGSDLPDVVRTLAAVGVGAVMLEDQRAPKTGAIVPGLGPPLEETGRFSQRVADAVAATNGRIPVIARTNSTGDDLGHRLGSYAEAGAEILFPFVLDDAVPLPVWAEVARVTGRPLACTLAPGSWSERTIDTATAASVGIRLIVHSLHGLLAAATAYRRTADELLRGVPAQRISSSSMAYRDLRRSVLRSTFGDQSSS